MASCGAVFYEAVSHGDAGQGKKAEAGREQAGSGAQGEPGTRTEVLGDGAP